MSAAQHVDNYGVSDDNYHHRAPPFCNCNTPDNCSDFRYIRNAQVTGCKCGEDATDKMEWTWDDKQLHPSTEINGPNVVFHPIYSQGSSIIRGAKPLEFGMHHYWEIKVVSCLSGTDVMMGIGTESVDLREHQYRFTSPLGLNDQSWGYSYRGLIQHGGHLKYYGKKYTRGCIVSVHLDLHKGRMEFYLNRKTQGLAFTNIPLDPKIKYFPMACSTSAKSVIKLMNATSYEDNLQFNCMKKIAKNPQLLKIVQNIPGLKPLCQDLWFLQCKEQFRYGEFEKNNLLLEDEAILCGLKKKNLRHINDSDSSDCSSLDGVYDNMHKIKQMKTADTTTSSSEQSDDATSPFHLFCDH